MLRNMLLLLIVWGLFIIVATSCSTTEPAKPRCSYVPIGYMQNVMPEFKVDEFHRDSAEQGCIRRYGEHACLVSFVKTGDRSYQALCRKEVP
jgi:hypothetical protein